jgi:hypothetical protein
VELKYITQINIVYKREVLQISNLNNLVARELKSGCGGQKRAILVLKVSRHVVLLLKMS